MDRSWNKHNFFYTQGNDVAYNGRQFVAVGSGTNSIAYSTDGLTWTGIGATIFTSAGNGISWNNERWVAVGFGGPPIAYSSNGISWTTVSTSTSIFSSSGSDVCWDGRRWIAVGEGTANDIATSYDGITWYGVATSTSLFTTGVGLSTSYNASSNQLVISNTNGQTLSNRLEIVADSYYNQGPTEMTVSITATIL